MTAPPIAPALPGTEGTLRTLFGPRALGIQNGQSQANQVAAPNDPEDVDTTEPVDRLKGLMQSLYGADFPLVGALDRAMAREPIFSGAALPPMEVLLQETQPDEWVKWTKGRWAKHRAAVEMHVYLIGRNRLFRAGQQWVSSKGREPWREPPRPAEQARIVHNLVAPALDQRLQIITDQRPGFEVEPSALSPEEKRKADGRQRALEYQYDQQEMERHIHEAGFWAGTDGVAFWHVVWDRDAGPLDQRMGTNGEPRPLGDVRTLTLRCEQVRVSANATATRRPHYVVIREVLSEEEAAQLYGEAGSQTQSRSSQADAVGGQSTAGTGADGLMPSWVLTQTIVGEGNRLNNIRTVERFTLYCEKHPDVLPEGLQVVVLGNALIWGPGELLFGMIPVIPVRDGSTDPSYYPRPIMEQWIPAQQAINAAVSLWVNSVRVNSGGRFLARPDAISRETFSASGCSILEVQGAGPLDDTIQPVNGFLVGQDVKDLVALKVKEFEDLSGYNDTSRGQISGDASGRAILAAREQLERVFTPPVTAVARAMTDWAKVVLAAMAWGYDVPRDVGVVGSDRPDLARSLQAEDFDGPTNVRVNPETLIPMPRAFRLFLLDTWLSKGLITPQMYMRNVKFATFQDLTTPDVDQEARAKRMADAIRLKQEVPPLRWQTNEAILQDVLEREILLQDDLDPDVIAVADQLWKQAAAQAQQKQMPPGALPPNGPAGSGGPPVGPPGASPFAPSPAHAPLLAGAPSIAASPSEPSVQDQAARQFEQTATQ